MQLNEGLGRSTVLVVDDTPENLTLMAELLMPEYRVKVANSAMRALKIAQAMPPDLLLLDIMMPEMDGYELCRLLKADRRTSAIPVIFLTARSTVEDERLGLELGAVDYIVKPISPPIVLARVRTHLALKAAADFLRDKNEYLEYEIRARTDRITALQDATIQVVTSLAETRDPDTGNHIRRTQNYMRAIAERLARRGGESHELSPEAIVTLYKSAPLHDIGKVGIPDQILLKPGKLSHAEFERMKTHTTVGYEAITRAEQELGMEVDFLKMAKQIALSHHEHWDGSGYPQGLAGSAIPLAARLMAVADVYDALITARVYKQPIPHEQAILMMRQGRGSHFDPVVFDAFMEIEEEIRQIAHRYEDASPVASLHLAGLPQCDSPLQRPS